MKDKAIEVPKTEEANPCDVQLVGGPFDGFGYVVGANFAVCLPDRLEFFGAEEERAGWHGYEKVPSAEWEEEARYNFTGFRFLN